MCQCIQLTPTHARTFKNQFGNFSNHCSTIIIICKVHLPLIAAGWISFHRNNFNNFIPSDVEFQSSEMLDSRYHTQYTRPNMNNEHFFFNSLVAPYLIEMIFPLKKVQRAAMRKVSIKNRLLLCFLFFLSREILTRRETTFHDTLHLSVRSPRAYFSN